MVSRTVGDAGTAFELCAGSFAEVFGSLLDVVKRRLEHARKVVVAK